MALLDPATVTRLISTRFAAVGSPGNTVNLYHLGQDWPGALAAGGSAGSGASSGCGARLASVSLSRRTARNGNANDADVHELTVVVECLGSARAHADTGLADGTGAYSVEFIEARVREAFLGYAVLDGEHLVEIASAAGQDAGPVAVSELAAARLKTLTITGTAQRTAGVSLAALP